MYYRKKTDKVIEAWPWYQNGDHPKDFHQKGTVDEGKLVSRYRRPDRDGLHVCAACGYYMHDHGWIDSDVAFDSSGEYNEGYTVCPGSYVITETVPTKDGSYNEPEKYYVISKALFEDVYKMESFVI